MSGECTTTAGKAWAATEPITTSGLNATAAPVVRVNEHSIGDRELDPAALLALVAEEGRPNQAINGNFDIWQRGGYPSFTLVNHFGDSGADEYTADHWFIGTAPGVNKREISRGSFDTGQTDVPNEPTYYLHWKQLIGHADPSLSQPFEDVRRFAGKKVTVTGWLRATRGGAIQVGFDQFFGGSPGETVEVDRQNVTLIANAPWTKFTLTFDIPPLAGHTVETGSCVWLKFLLFSGSAGVTFELDFAQIKVELGEKATAFNPRTMLEEQQACERYFEYTGGVMADDITHVLPCYYFATRKYRAPTLTLLAGFAGTGATFDPILETGFYQSMANSEISAFFMACDAEI